MEPEETDRPGNWTWALQLGFAALAGLVVFGFVDMAKVAESRRACEAVLQLRPRYMGSDRTAPAFDLPTLAGPRLRLADYRGKVVILHFWTKTCQPCLEELPHLAQFAEQIRNRRDVAVLTVTIDDGPEAIRDVVQTLFQGKALPFPVGFDPENALVLGRYGTKLFPETWLIDGAGTIRARFDGVPQAGETCDIVWRSPLLLSAIDALHAPATCDLSFDPKVDPRPDHLLAPCRGR